jgi:hypothetical protein
LLRPFQNGLVLQEQSPRKSNHEHILAPDMAICSAA